MTDHTHHPASAPMPSAHPQPPHAAQYRNLGEMLQRRDWGIEGEELDRVRVKFNAFTKEVTRFIKVLLAGAKLPVDPLAGDGPRIIPVMHTNMPNLAGHLPRNGEWHLGINPDGSFIEFRFAGDKADEPWETREVTAALTDPAYCMEAISLTLDLACKRRAKITANLDEIGAQCEQAARFVRQTVRELQNNQVTTT